MWNAIERRAKEVEHFRGEMIVPCINVMLCRRRIVEVINQEAKPPGQVAAGIDARVWLLAAKDHLRHAEHDLTDAVIFLAHNRIVRTIARHGRKKVNKRIPDFVRLYPEIKQAEKIVQGSRENRLGRKADYERLASDYLPIIISLYEKFEEDDGLSLEDNVIAWWIKVNMGLTVVASIASILGLVASLLGLYLVFNPPVATSVEPQSIQAP